MSVELPKTGAEGDQNACRNCGGWVSSLFVRVRGTPDGEVFACQECSTRAQRLDGACTDPDYPLEEDRSQYQTIGRGVNTPAGDSQVRPEGGP